MGCIDPSTQPEYCGFDACVDSTGKQPCGAGELCQPDIDGVGQCEPKCPTAGKVSCCGTCIDPNTNNDYCGAQAGCQQAIPCAAGQTCSDGTCQ